jgi:hypothetical protein
MGGLLMLGQEIAIRELLPHWHLSYRELPDDPQDPPLARSACARWYLERERFRVLLENHPQAA